MSLSTIDNKLRIFEILFCTSLVNYGGADMQHNRNRDSLPNFLKLIRFGVIVPKNEIMNCKRHFISI